MIRRIALVALAITAVLAPNASAAAKKYQTLDGQRTTSFSYSGSLSGPTVFTGLLLSDATPAAEPDPSWCTPDTCDQSGFHLTLPAGRQSGRLVIELTGPESGTGSMHFVVYDAKGRPLPGQSTCCASNRFVATRMAKGDINVVVYDDAGMVSFDVDVSWKANPPHRTTPSGSGR